MLKSDSGRFVQAKGTLLSVVIDNLFISNVRDMQIFDQLRQDRISQKGLVSQNFKVVG
jgi:hypothetical protein